MRDKMEHCKWESYDNDTQNIIMSSKNEAINTVALKMLLYNWYTVTRTISYLTITILQRDCELYNVTNKMKHWDNENVRMWLWKSNPLKFKNMRLLWAIASFQEESFTLWEKVTLLLGNVCTVNSPSSRENIEDWERADTMGVLQNIFR